MNLRNTDAGPLRVSLTAHQGPEGKILLIEAQCSDEPRTRKNLELAVVIDRSGSMQGRKLEIARQATAEMIRTLHPADRITVVAYDDNIDVLCPLSPPSPGLAHLVERIHAGGSTNLYGGWVRGAKSLPPGGRVLLLSDGLANQGRYQHAHDLARHAGISYEKFRITTSTIGIGEDYDESLMAGMARSGGGTHYFAYTAESVRGAFSQERFSVGSIAVGFVSLRIDGTDVHLGHFWGGETKRAAVEVRDLPKSAEIIYTPAGGERPVKERVGCPAEFGKSDQATFQYLLDRAIALEGDAGTVRSRESASSLRESLRSLLLAMLNHPLADCDDAKTAIARVEASCDRLEQLSIVYDERMATMHRKRSMQSSHNMRERAKSFSSFDDERDLVLMDYRSHAGAPAPATLQVDAAEAAKAPVDRWRSWQAVPVVGPTRTLAMVNPKDGFTIAEIESVLGGPSRPVVLQGGVQELEMLLATYAP